MITVVLFLFEVLGTQIPSPKHVRNTLFKGSCFPFILTSKKHESFPNSFFTGEV